MMKKVWMILLAVFLVMGLIALPVLADVGTPLPDFLADEKKIGTTQEDLDALNAYAENISKKDASYKAFPLLMTDPSGNTLIAFGSKNDRFPLFIYHVLRSGEKLGVSYVEYCYEKDGHYWVRIGLWFGLEDLSKVAEPICLDCDEPVERLPESTENLLMKS